MNFFIFYCYTDIFTCFLNKDFIHSFVTVAISDLQKKGEPELSCDLVIV